MAVDIEGLRKIKLHSHELDKEYTERGFFEKNVNILKSGFAIQGH